MNYQSKESCRNIEDVTDGADGQPRCAVASGSPPGLFNLYVRHTDGRMKKLTGYAMTHNECCVMKSKLSEWSQARTLLVKEDGK